MSQVTMPVDQRFHVEIFDESGATLNINNLTREEYSDFEMNHLDDDLEYFLEVGAKR